LMHFAFYWLIFLDKGSQVSYFSGGGSSRGRRLKQGEDGVHSLRVSLEDLYNGTSMKLSF
jgi:DnaJ family protein A protein 2